MSRASDWRRSLDDLATEYGCTLELTNGSHFKIKHPSGWFVFTACTPSDPRALRYVKSDLKRKAAGVWR